MQLEEEKPPLCNGPGRHLLAYGQFTFREVARQSRDGGIALIVTILRFLFYIQKDLPEVRKPMNEWLRRAIVWGTALVIGIYDGFYGPGTGTFLLLSFCYLAKIDVRTASGNVKLVNLSSNIGALCTSLMAGKVLIPLGLMAAVFAIAGQYLGAGLAMKNGSKIIRPVILVVILLLAAKVLLEFFGIA